MTVGLAFEAVTKRYGPDGPLVFRDLSISVAPGEFVVVVGPSGCGKTTLLQLAAGVEAPTAGTVRVGGAPVDGPTEETAMVFQDFVLLPWKTVLENVALGLAVQERMDPDRRRAVAREWLETVGLADVADRYPRALSGGMCQRVGLARALAVDPAVVLLDEPFGSLDAQTRHRLQGELLALWSEREQTACFVTHDVDEALFLADRVVVLSDAPAEVVAERSVPFERPRAQRRAEIEQSERFASLRTALRRDLGLTDPARAAGVEPA
ncbi:MAG: ABC transporter ATP-binding protein [Halobacteriaceae archaeon]